MSGVQWNSLDAVYRTENPTHEPLPQIDRLPGGQLHAAQQLEVMGAGDQLLT